MLALPSLSEAPCPPLLDQVFWEGRAPVEIQGEHSNSDLEARGEGQIPSPALRRSEFNGGNSSPIFPAALPTSRSPPWCRTVPCAQAAPSPLSHQSAPPPESVPLLTSHPPRTATLNLNSHPPYSCPPFIHPGSGCFLRPNPSVQDAGSYLGQTNNRTKQTTRQNQRVGVRIGATPALRGHLGLLPSRPHLPRGSCQLGLPCLA